MAVARRDRGRPDEDLKPRVFPAQAVLGLSPGESALAPEGRASVVAEVIGPSKFSRLERGEENVIYLPDSAADRLGVREGDTVKLGGIDLIVAGLYDPDEFDQKALTLSGEPIAPLNYKSGALDAGGKSMAEEGDSQSLDLG